MRRIHILAAAILLATTATAQTIQKEVNVTRVYEPVVSDFLKQQIDPDLNDTTRLTPDYNYDIIPRPLSAGLEMQPIGLVSVTTIDNLDPLPFYLRAGGGVPGQSTLFMSLAKEYEKGSAGATINHYAHYGDIKNDEGVEAPAFQTFNSARLFGNREFGRDFWVDGELGYDFNRISRYGYYTYGDPLPAETDVTEKGLEQYFNILKGRIKFGNSFTDMTKVNWSVTVDETMALDRFGFDIRGFKARADVGFKAGTGIVRINGQYNNVNGDNKLQGLNGDFAVASVSYGYSDIDGFRATLGADITHDITGNVTNFLPQLNIEYSIAEGILMPFIDLQSYQQSNTYLTQATRNPWVVPGTGAPRTYNWDGRVGVKGTLFKMLNYKLYGGYGLIENIYHYVNHYDLIYAGNAFTTISDTVSLWRSGIEAGVTIGAVELYGGLEYRAFETDNYLYIGGVPDLEASFGAHYNYRKKLYANVEGVLFGERFFYENYGGELIPVKAKSMMEVNVGFDYVLNKHFGFFVDVNNVLNQKLYRFNRLPLLGINGMAGVKLSF